jgi:hypothetical protein
MDARPGGPAAKHQPSPEGLGINPEDDVSAVGAALNLALLAPVPLGESVTFLIFRAKSSTLNEMVIPTFHSNSLLIREQTSASNVK